MTYIDASTTGFFFPTERYEVFDINLMLKSLLPVEVKVKNIIDDIRLRSNLTASKAIRFTKKSSFYTLLSFTQCHSGALGDIEGFAQLIPSKYKSQKPINIAVVDKVHLKCDCINGSIGNGVREPILYSIGLFSPLGQKNFKEPRIKLFKKTIKSV